MSNQIALIVALATCYEKGCSEKAVGLRIIGKNTQAAYCEKHLKSE